MTADALAPLVRTALAAFVSLGAVSAVEVVAQHAEPRQERTAPRESGEPTPLTPAVAPTDGPIAGAALWWMRQTAPPSGGWWSNLELGCAGCGPSRDQLARPENPNAPWAVQGRVRYQRSQSAFFAGVVGVRQFAAPVYTAMSIGGDFQPGGVSTSQGNAFVPETQWQMSAGAQRTLLATTGGATLDVRGDVIVPLRVGPRTGDLNRIEPLPSRAIRIGLVWRW